LERFLGPIGPIDPIRTFVVCDSIHPIQTSCSNDVGKSRVKGSTTQQINKQGAKEETQIFSHAKI
jgi:hypothetical protein